MMFKRTLISSISIGALVLTSAAPAFAYVLPGGGYSGPAIQSVPGITYPSVLGYPYRPGSYVRHDRDVTSRDVVKHARRLNAPRVGYIRQFGGGRGLPEADYTGRSMLPLRSYVRYQQRTLRGYGRHVLGRERGLEVGEYTPGRYRILNRRGDVRRRPLGFPQITPSTMFQEPQASLPPFLIQTGGNVPAKMAVNENTNRPTRRSIVNVAELVNPPLLGYF